MQEHNTLCNHLSNDSRSMKSSTSWLGTVPGVRPGCEQIAPSFEDSHSHQIDFRNRYSRPQCCDDNQDGEEYEQSEPALDHRTRSFHNSRTQDLRHESQPHREESNLCGEHLAYSKEPFPCPFCGCVVSYFRGCNRKKIWCCDSCNIAWPRNMRRT